MQGRGWKTLLAAAALLALVLWYAHPRNQLSPEGGPATTTDSGAALPYESVTNSQRGRSAIPNFLPPEARDTLSLIARLGPFPHPQDGEVFGNYEHHLPEEPRGYYHEYTVETPGLGYRGARRIITGGTPPSVYYYTGDHYDTFREFEVSPR